MKALVEPQLLRWFPGPKTTSRASKALKYLMKLISIMIQENQSWIINGSRSHFGMHDQASWITTGYGYHL